MAHHIVIFSSKADPHSYPLQASSPIPAASKTAGQPACRRGDLNSPPARPTERVFVQEMGSDLRVRFRAGPVRMGARVLLARASRLRPSLDRPRAGDVGFRLGRSRGVDCWASVEDSMLLLGPPRSGKGQSVVIPMILESPGPVVTTSTRPDNLAVTLAARSRVGPVAERGLRFL
jgi:hypothetical protein